MLGFYPYVTMNQAPQSILHEAHGHVHGDRGSDYGHPIHDFQCTASLWRAYLKHRLGLDVPMNPTDVAMMMVMVKISRHANKRKRDNLVDIAGYCECADMIENYTGEPNQ